MVERPKGQWTIHNTKWQNLLSRHFLFLTFLLCAVWKPDHMHERKALRHSIVSRNVLSKRGFRAGERALGNLRRNLAEEGTLWKLMKQKMEKYIFFLSAREYLNLKKKFSQSWILKPILCNWNTWNIIAIVVIVIVSVYIVLLESINFSYLQRLERLGHTGVEGTDRADRLAGESINHRRQRL